MYTFFKKIDNFFFGKLHDQYPKMLEKEVLGCDSLLDVGCGFESPIRGFSSKIKHTVGVDFYEYAIERSKKAGIHNDYVVADVLQLDSCFGEKSFDCVVASDLIEHLKKEDGYRLIRMMEKIARKKVIIFTPNGFLPQREFDGNELQVHISGWEIEEMKKMGFRVVGINGLKFFRGEYSAIKYKPKVFWGRISLLSQLWTTRNPKRAFAIMCIKEFD